MKQRTITALITAPIAILLAAWPGGGPAVVAWTVILILAFGEYTAMCHRSGIPCRLWWGAGTILLFSLSAQKFNPPGPWLGQLTVLMVWLMLIVETGRPDRKPVAAMGSTLLGALWIGGLGSCLISLRFHQPASGFNALGIESGAWMVLGLLVIVWISDITAYLTGRFLGKTLLAPGISPKKTLEGAVGSFIAAAITGILTAPVLSIDITSGLVIGASIGVAAQVGDLFESSVKRELNTKDSGSMLPGHGGWLDRIDSLLVASAVTYWWVLLQTGGR